MKVPSTSSLLLASLAVASSSTSVAAAPANEARASRRVPENVVSRTRGSSINHHHEQRDLSGLLNSVIGALCGTLDPLGLGSLAGCPAASTSSINVASITNAVQAAKQIVSQPTSAIGNLTSALPLPINPSVPLPNLPRASAPAPPTSPQSPPAGAPAPPASAPAPPEGVPAPPAGLPAPPAGLPVPLAGAPALPVSAPSPPGLPVPVAIPAPLSPVVNQTSGLPIHAVVAPAPVSTTNSTNTTATTSASPRMTSASVH